MLRWMTPFLVAICAAGTAAAQSPGATKPADGPATAKPAESPAANQPTDKPVSARPADNQTTAKPAESLANTKPANSSPAAKRAGNPAAPRRATIVAAGQLPPGLPRTHYKYRTTVAPAAPLYVRRGRAVVIEEQTEVLFPPVGIAAYAPRINGTPLLPGSATLPGYYGTTHSYSYDGPYYGGPYTPYWDRLPYACGVYGYC
jgi:hypothetical protein